MLEACGERGGARLSLLVALALVGGLLAFGTLAEGAVTFGTNGLIVVDNATAGTLDLLDPNVNSRTTIPGSVAADANPAWSPLGDRIAFDNGGGLLITSTTGVRSAITAAGSGHADPEFSPDGNTLVFETGAGLATTPAATGPLTLLNGTVGAADVNPDFSPDGAFVVFDNQAAGGGIFRLNSNGTGGRTLLTGTAVGDANPRVSPDGSRVWFERAGAGIFSVPFPGGGAATALFGTPAAAINAAPSPDGAQVAFDSAAAAGVQRVPSGGGAPTAVSGAGIDDDTPSWGKQPAPPTPTPTPPGVTPTPSPTPTLAPGPGTLRGGAFRVSRSGRVRAGRRIDVCATGPAPSSTSQCTRTGRDGAYAFTLQSGNYQVAATKRRHLCRADTPNGEVSPVSRSVSAGAITTVDWFCSR